MTDFLSTSDSLSPESREYLKLTPSRMSYPTESVSDLLASLHALEPVGTEHGILERLRNRQTPATFTFTVLTSGEDAPVEFYLGSDANLAALADRLRAIYPQSFEIERVECDLLQRLLPPVEYTHEEFQERLVDGRLYVDPATIKSDTSSSSNAEPLPVSDGGTATGETGSMNSPVHTDSAGRQFEFRDGNVTVAPSSTLPPSSAPETALSQPTLTPDGTILARPAVFDETVERHAVTWTADTPKQHKDWMTTMQTLEEWFSIYEEDEETVADAPLSALIETLTDSEHPVGFRVVFQQYPDWTTEAEQRRLDIHEGENIGLLGKVIKSIGEEVFGPPPREVRERSARRRIRERDSGPKEGSDNAERLERLNDSDPSLSFAVNLSAIGLIPRDRCDETSSRKLAQTLDRLQSTLDPLGSPFYSMRTAGHTDGGWRSPVPDLIQQFVDPYVRMGRIRFGRHRHPRPEFILSPGELALFLLVPSADQLSDRAARSVQARQVARTPELAPEPKHMERLTEGLALGTPTQAPTADSPVDSWSPIHVSPSLLSYHYLRAAVSGSGKSIGVQNDGLSVSEDTEGPMIMVDAKGGDMLENFMRAYGKKYGMDRLKEDVLYFPVPEILPGLTIFDVRDVPANKRDQAVRERAAYYEEVLKLVMGADDYGDAKNAPQFIRALIEALFDHEYGCENGRYRASPDYFRHDQLDHVIDEFERMVSADATGGSLPDSTKDHVVRALRRRSGYNERTVRNILTGVTTRTGKISEDSDLRPLFNNTVRTFSFEEILDTDKKILFDLGELRTEPSRLMAGVLLTALYDDLKRQKPKLKAKPDEYVVNFLIDEAASVTISDTMTTLLKEGREFRISIGLATQFPEQLRLEGNESVYLNALNNIGTKIIGKVAIDDDLAEALATEDLPPAAVKNLFRAMPRGEFFVSMPSSVFGETGPTPFTVCPMSIPEGHPKSETSLTVAEERDFQQALDHIKTRTDEEYGIVEEELSLLTEVPPAVQEIVDVESGDLDRVLVPVIAAVQRRDSVRERNGWVELAEVNKTLTTSYESVACTDELPEEAELLTIEQRSHLFETHADDVAIDSRSEGDEVESLQIRLSDTGEKFMAETLSPSASAQLHQTEGSEDHIVGLERIQSALEPEGWTVTIVDQDGSDLPDARGVHPSLDVPIHIELELSTTNKPAKILENLRKAQHKDAFPVFVVQADPDELAYWARTVDGVLHRPIKGGSSGGEYRYYTTDRPIVFNHDDRAVRALRPTAGADDSHQSVWQHDGGEYVLLDRESTEHLRVDDLDEVEISDFPAFSWKDKRTSEIVVQTASDEFRYVSEEHYHAHWAEVRWPFDPVRELPNPEYDRDDYVIIILPTEDTPDLNDPVVFNSAEGATLPLDSLLDAISTSGGSDPTKISPSSSLVSSADETLTPKEAAPEFFESCVFTVLDLDNDPSLASTGRFDKGDLVLPRTWLWTAFSNWYELHYGESVSRMKFSRQIITYDVLSSSLNFDWESVDECESPLTETRRRVDWIDENRPRCYLDLGLTQSGIDALDS